MAEALLRVGLPADREVSSAGLAALVGYPADPFAVEVMREHGHDIDEHRARQAVQPLLAHSDLILALDQTHVDGLLLNYPQLRGRVHKLRKWRDNRDIADPYKGPRAAFERAYADIEPAVADWLARLS